MCAIEAKSVEITINDTTTLWEVKGIVRSGSRGKEYQLGKFGDSRIHCLCYAPECKTDNKIFCCGQSHKYNY